MKPTTRRSAGRWIVTFTVTLLLSASLLGFITYLFLLQPGVQKKFLHIVHKKINSITAGSISIGSVSTNLLSMIDIQDVIIGDSTGKPTLIRIDHFRVTYFLPMLLMRRISISSVVVNRVGANIEIDSTGKLNLPQWLSKSKNNGASADQNNSLINEFNIKSLVIKELNVDFKDYAHNQNGNFRGASLFAYLPEIDSVVVALHVPSGEYSSNWWNGIIDSIALDAIITNKKLKINQLIIGADKSALHGKGTIPFQKNGYWDLVASVSTEVDAVPALYLNLSGLERRGRISADATWKGTLVKPEMNAQLSSYGIEYKGIVFDTSSISAHYDQSERVITSISIVTPYGTSIINSEISIPALLSSPKIAEYSSDIDLEKIDISEIKPVTPLLHGLSGTITLSGKIHTEGSGFSSLPQSLTLHGVAEGLPYIPEKLIFNASLFERHWEMAAQSGNDSCHATGELLEKQMVTGNIDLLMKDLSSIGYHFINESISGSIHAKISVNGTIHSPEFEIKASSSGLRAGNVRVDSLEATAIVSATEKRLHSFSILGDADIDSLPVPFRIDSLGGKVAFKIQGEGTLLAPDIEATVSGRDLYYRRFQCDSCTTCFNFLKLDTIRVQNCFVWKGPTRLSVENASVFFLQHRSGAIGISIHENETGHLRKMGEIRLQGRYFNDSCSAEYEVSDFSPGALSRFFPWKQLISGNISTSGNLSGSIYNPKLNIKLAVSNISYERSPEASGTVSITLQDSLAEITSSFRIDTIRNPIFIKGSIPLLPSSSWQIDTSGVRPCSLLLEGEKITLRHFSLSSDSSWDAGGETSFNLTAASVKNRLEIGGSINLENGHVALNRIGAAVANIRMHAAVSGTVRDPCCTWRIIAGPAELSGGRIERVSIDGRASKERVEILSSRVALTDSGAVDMVGEVPIHQPGWSVDAYGLRMECRIRRLPLSVFESFTPETDVREGVLNGEATLSFVEKKPRIDGVVQLENAAFSSEAFAPALGPVDASADFFGDSVSITSLTAQWGKGTISAGGYLKIAEDGRPVIDIRATADNIAWSAPDVYQCAIERASVAYASKNGGASITGAIRLGRSRFIQDVQITDLLESFRNPSHQKSNYETGGTLDSIRMNVAVDLQENAVIDMNLGNMRLDGDCMLTGTLAQPSFTGEVVLTEGYVYYLDRRFTIERATLSNYNPNELDPVIDLEAQSDVAAISGDQMETYTIILTLKGNVKNPQISIKEKTGVLNELELFSILTFGQPIGGVSGDAKERVKDFIGRSIVGFGTRKVEQRLGIEKFEIQGDLFGGKEAVKNTRVTIAKKVTPRLMVLYETDIGQLNRPKLSALYRITDRFYLSGERNGEGDAGVDLIFKYSR